MSYIDVVEHKNKIHSWERDREGELHYSIHDVPYHLYMRDNTGKSVYKDMYGHPMKKVEFDSHRKLKAFSESHKDVIAESDVKPVYRFLIDNFRNADTESPYNVSFFDIEVDFDLSEGKGYPSPKNPYGEINAFSIFDSHFDAYVMLIPWHLKGKVNLSDKREGKHVEIIWTKNEKDMLRSFADYIQHVDITSGWNSNAFDFPYIMERAIILFGEKKAKTLFTRNGVPARRRDFVNDFGEDAWEWSYPGRPHLDMMLLFKKFHPGEKKSFKLDNICEEELGEKKEEYEGDLGRLYREDPQAFFEYSLHDSRLLRFLDDKQKIIDLGMGLTRGMCSLPGDVFGSIRVIEMGIIKHARLKGNIVVPDNKEESKEGQYAGAVVYDSIPGRHKWIMSADLVSLYPKCMILLGLSPETMMYQCEGGYEDYVAIIERDDSVGELILDGVNGEESTSLYPSEVDDLIRSNGFTISGNGTIFSGEMGLMAEWLADNFNKRAEYKKRMKECYQKGDIAQGNMFNLYQQVRKILINSCYGAAGNKHFRFYDIRLALSVTLTAQVVSKAQAVFTNEAINIVASE